MRVTLDPQSAIKPGSASAVIAAPYVDSTSPDVDLELKVLQCASVRLSASCRLIDEEISCIGDGSLLRREARHTVLQPFNEK